MHVLVALQDSLDERLTFLRQSAANIEQAREAVACLAPNEPDLCLSRGQILEPLLDRMPALHELSVC